jgi:dihydroflavonol-4-reductase
MILLTGATGLLGGHTLYALLQRYERIVALRREGSSVKGLREIFSYYTDNPAALLERIEWRTGDMLDQESLVRALEGISCVINCAAIVSFDPSKREELIRNNVEGCRNLAEAMKKSGVGSLESGVETHTCVWSQESGVGSRLIHISSTSALGDSPGDDPAFLVDEETPRNPHRKHTGYSESKFLSENSILKAFSSPDSKLQTLECLSTPDSRLQTPDSRLPTTVFLNPGIILGPGQWEKGSSQLFVKAWEGLRFYTKGGTGYVDVRDVADVVVRIVEMWKCDNVITPEPITLSHFHIPQEPPNVLSGTRYCLVGANLLYRDFFNRVTDAFGKPNPSIYAGRFLSELAWRMDTLRARLTGRNPLLTRETAESAQRISFYSSEKIKQELGFSFRNIEETVKWVCSAYRRSRESGVGSRDA